MNTFLRLPEVRRRTGVGTSTIYLWMSQGRFPRPRKLGPRAVGWDADEFERWASDRRSSDRASSYAPSETAN